VNEEKDEGEAFDWLRDAYMYIYIWIYSGNNVKSQIPWTHIHQLFWHIASSSLSVSVSLSLHTDTHREHAHGYLDKIDYHCAE
jgi:hypothetical protein